MALKTISVRDCSIPSCPEIGQVDLSDEARKIDAKSPDGNFEAKLVPIYLIDRPKGAPAAAWCISAVGKKLEQWKRVEGFTEKK